MRPRRLALFCVSGALAAYALGVSTRGDQVHQRAVSERPTATGLLVSPDGEDSAPCTHALPCQTFARAYQAAEPGAVVDVAPGVYPRQEVGPDGRPPTARPVVFRGSPDGSARLRNELVVTAAAVEFRDLTVTGIVAGPGASHVTFRNLHDRSGLFITSAEHISFIGGSVGPGVNFSPEIKAALGSRVPPRDILIDGVTFHDWTRDDPAAHVDCLHVLAVDGLTIRNSRFRNCEAFALLFTVMGDAGAPRNVVVEDSVLSCCRSGYFSLALAGDGFRFFRNFLIRGNRSDKDFTIVPGSTAADSNIRILRNTIPYSNPLNCQQPGVIWDYNTWAAGEPCGSHDRVVKAAPTDSEALDGRG